MNVDRENVLQCLEARLPEGRDVWETPMGEAQWPQAAVAACDGLRLEPRHNTTYT